MNIPEGEMLRIGVIGTGSMGKNHARVCTEVEQVELVGIADTDKKAANTIAQRFDVKPFYDYKELLPEIDAAIIASFTAKIILTIAVICSYIGFMLPKRIEKIFLKT